MYRNNFPIIPKREMPLFSKIADIVFHFLETKHIRIELDFLMITKEFKPHLFQSVDNYKYPESVLIPKFAFENSLIIIHSHKRDQDVLSEIDFMCAGRNGIFTGVVVYKESPELIIGMGHAR